MLITDKRATLQLRIVLNKWSGNKNSINTQLAELITQFSHSTAVAKGCMFCQLLFFLVS